MHPSNGTDGGGRLLPGKQERPGVRIAFAGSVSVLEAPPYESRVPCRLLRADQGLLPARCTQDGRGDGGNGCKRSRRTGSLGEAATQSERPARSRSRAPRPRAGGRSASRSRRRRPRRDRRRIRRRRPRSPRRDGYCEGGAARRDVPMARGRRTRTITMDITAEPTRRRRASAAAARARGRSQRPAHRRRGSESAPRRGRGSPSPSSPPAPCRHGRSRTRPA
jgi:hypothetical protein